MAAEQTTERIFDLLLKGGRVIDPANNVDGLFDVAIVGRFIALVDKDISPDLAKKLLVRAFIADALAALEDEGEAERLLEAALDVLDDAGDRIA